MRCWPSRQRVNVPPGRTAEDAEVALLQTLCSEVKSTPTQGPILGCGSGLTSILLAALLEGSSRVFWTLEHEHHRAVELRAQLLRCGIDGPGIRVLEAPMLTYGARTRWYDLRDVRFPSQSFDLVVCRQTATAAGLLDVLFDRLSDDCTVVIPETANFASRSLVDGWRTRSGVSCSESAASHASAIVCQL